jgi:predicted phage replisome organizer
MAEVKWIKVSTDMFNSSRKIKQIEVMPEGDAILVIWLKLLLLAGNINDGGAIYITPEIPYTDEMLANELRRPLNTVRLALNTFEHFGMIEIIDDILHLSSWEKYQSTDKLAELREKDRDRKRIKRAQQKNALSEGVRGQSTDSPSIEEDREEDKEKEILSISLARAKNEAVDNFVDNEDNEEQRIEAQSRQRKYLRGELGEGLILMSDEQFAHLLEVYSLDEIHYYFEVIKEQIRKGHRYRKTHFQAFIDMAEKDRKKGKSECESD